MKGKNKISRLIALILTIIIIMATLPSCGNDKDIIYSVAQLNSEDYTIGTMNGAASMYESEKYFDKANLKYHSSVLEGYESVDRGKTDAVVFDETTLKAVVKERDTLTILKDSAIGSVDIAVGISKAVDNKEELTLMVNEFLAKNKDVADDMKRRWIDGEDYTMPEIEPSQNPVGTLKVATEALNYPMSYISEDEFSGYDIELAKRIAQYANMELEIVNNNWMGCVASVESGAVDLFISSVNKTESNGAHMDFSNAYLTTNIVVMVRKDRVPKNTYATAAYTLSDLNGAKLGAVTGSTYQTITADYIDDPEIVQANSFSDLVLMVTTGKIDGYLMDEPIARMHCAANAGITYLNIANTEQNFAFSYGKENKSDYISQLNLYIANITLDPQKKKALEDKWFTTDETYKTVIDYKSLPATNGTINVAVTDTVVPFSYTKEGKIVGYDMDIMANFCKEYGYALNAVTIPDLSLALLGVETGTYDFLIGGLTETESRKKTMNFLTPTYKGGIVAVVPSVLPMYTSFDEIEGKKIGVFTGSISDYFLDRKLESYKQVEFMTEADMMMALKNETIDAYMVDLPVAQIMASKDSSLTIFPQEFDVDEYCFPFKQGSEYRDDFNEFLKQIKADGSLKSIISKWTDEDVSNNIIPEEYYLSKEEGDKGTFRIAVSDTKEPLTYIDTATGKAIGLEVEILYYYAYTRGMYVECSTGTFSGILAGVQEDRYDVVAGSISLTDEREEVMDLSISHYASQPVLVVRNLSIDSSNSGTTFFDDLYASFERTFITEGRWKLILQGALTTLIISVAAGILGTILGFVVCLGRRSKIKFFNWISSGFIKFMQGTPILVFLMILYYIVFASIDLSAVIVSIIGFALNFAAYTSEMMRTGVDALDKGQLEASKALGFTKTKSFLFITLPQAAKHVIPVFRGEFISMVKMTSIVGYISVQDLTKMGDIIRSRTYEAFFPLIAIAIIYFVMSFFLVSILNIIEKRLHKRNGKNIKGVKIHD